MCPQPAASLITHTSSTRFRPDAYVYKAVSIEAGHTFQLVGGHPATDFINTLDWRFRESGAEELLKRFTDLVRFMMQSKLISPVQGRRLANTVDDRSAERTLKSGPIVG